MTRKKLSEEEEKVALRAEQIFKEKCVVTKSRGALFDPYSEYMAAVKQATNEVYLVRKEVK